ncbi:MAG: L-glutamate gamma-semialdehyde dehydrogenase [Actinobacteria bacterium]|nr:L-glutamate gamma-semialdehyde dehydrogenase [Actinomycetota bacterium]
MVSRITEVPEPANEPVRSYARGSAERAALSAEIEAVAADVVEAPHIIAGEPRTADETFAVSAPHRRDLHLADVHQATPRHVEAAIEACEGVAEQWAATPFEERAAIFLRAADLLAGPWRDRINAATVLGQSKSWHQAEIDAACEAIDFLRFNAAFARDLLAIQPLNARGIWNRMDYRPLEGFVLAITPFNFTAIALNLPTAPALLGNTVLWKPSEKQALAAHWSMQLLLEAGLPPGVINLVHGDGALVSDIATQHPNFAGLHFTGSMKVLQGLWQQTAERLDTYRAFPTIVGESGGKDFVVAHPSALVDELVVALGRGAFEYQGQKCSAASRAYIPQSLWNEVRDGIADLADAIPTGDVADPAVFFGAVIDEPAFRKHADAIAEATDGGAKVLVGGGTDDEVGWFVEPTVLVSEDPQSLTMSTELFGPILTVYVYDDARWSDTLDLVDGTSPYALTGAVFSQDRAAVREAAQRLRHAAGNFYINDKPTGSVVGQQPFGGARRSGTNDKAGSIFNLQRWVSPRAIKETFVPSTDWRYPHLG